MFKKNKQSGFTLIELLVVVAIVGLLVTVAAVALNNSRVRSRDTKRKGDLKQVYTALNLYQSGAGNGSYPSTGGDWECFNKTGGAFTELTAHDLMAQLPSDPVSTRDSLASGCYRYRSNDGNDFKVMASLELDTEGMENDGGSSDSWYEIFTRGAQSY